MISTMGGVSWRDYLGLVCYVYVLSILLVLYPVLLFFLLRFSIFVNEGVEALGGLWEWWLFRLFHHFMLISCTSIPFNLRR